MKYILCASGLVVRAKAFSYKSSSFEVSPPPPPPIESTVLNLNKVLTKDIYKNKLHMYRQQFVCSMFTCSLYLHVLEETKVVCDKKILQENP